MEETFIACERGIYTNFTGVVLCPGNEFEVCNACFDIINDGISEYSIIFHSGHISQATMWSWGIWENGIWEGGTWKNGIWKSGIWKNGIWENGLWVDRNWIGGKSVQCSFWLGGTWVKGFDYLYQWKNTSPDKW